MTSSKIPIRDEVLKYKDAYTNTKDKAYLVAAAATKGIYVALGGSKAIALPQKYTFITTVTCAVARAILKFTGDTEKDINKINNELNHFTNGTIFVKYSYYQYSKVLEVINTGNGSLLGCFTVDNQINIDVLANIAIILIQAYGNIGIESMRDYEVLTRVLMTELARLERNGR